MKLTKASTDVSAGRLEVGRHLNTFIGYYEIGSGICMKHMFVYALS